MPVNIGFQIKNSGGGGKPLLYGIILLTIFMSYQNKKKHLFSNLK
jgi:hypothetical protein